MRGLLIKILCIGTLFSSAVGDAHALKSPSNPTKSNAPLPLAVEDTKLKGRFGYRVRVFSSHKDEACRGLGRDFTENGKEIDIAVRIDMVAIVLMCEEKQVFQEMERDLISGNLRYEDLAWGRSIARLNNVLTHRVEEILFSKLSAIKLSDKQHGFDIGMVAWLFDDQGKTDHVTRALLKNNDIAEITAFVAAYNKRFSLGIP